ncbi:hypothetical protein PQ472_08345 [Lacticaseibacillus pabuli]|uniref:DUF5666 domain-containing protein n=1 Tax=Lacticaseibacillus pabuli TaxID=3025672 RepID=A0ABY7WNZ8_9LACO|nr:hypothetical protein [Lacticaseibacillus sp. KACC 23028]WDF81932.1 hypothetical protein PQ472_08345 [Lacticaseibacillus sp. KACC 23028]
MEIKKQSKITVFGVFAIVAVVAFIIAIIFSVTAKHGPQLVSGVSDAGVAKLGDYDDVTVKINVPDGKFVSEVIDGTVYETKKVKHQKYTYTDFAGAKAHKIELVASDNNVKDGTKLADLNGFGSVKFKIPVEKISDDDDDSDTDTSDDDSDTDTTDDDSDDTDTVTDTAPASYRNDITFDMLARSPDDYEGAGFTMTGKVVQVLESDDDDTIELRVAINGDYDDIVLIDYDSSIMNGKRVLEDDKITFNGRSKGTVTYESTQGGDITVPAAQVYKVTDYGTASDDYGY